ncbi:PAS domain-containing protein [Arenibaculum sp.]|uniref:PAS domain-containing protein n=1 Tax=Arenibaculum sp. TaxID=2865862 RepID=UPI002E107270|nr:PAS domain-containing protein [Arenibaculum sp.]
MAAAQVPTFAASLIASGGETGRLIASHDWSSTPLGPIEAWPQSLRTALGMILLSPVPMVMLWGEDGTMLYNDAYSVFAGGRHPALLGSKVREGWPEVADFNDNVMKVGLAGGTLAYRDQELTLHRHGRPEQVWMNLDYSPVPDETGRPAGVIAIVVETTERVLTDRRADAERRRLIGLFDQAPGFICIMRGPEHVYEFANRAHDRVFQRENIVGRRVRDVFPDLEGQGIYELLDEVYATGRRHVASGVPLRYRFAPDGPPEERFLDFIYEPIVEEDGTVSGIFCEGHDVTDTHRAHGALRWSEARRAEQLQGLAQAALAVARAPTLDATLDEITGAARRLVGAHQAVVSLTKGPDWAQAINAVAFSDHYARWRDYAAVTDGSGIYAWVCEANRPVRMTQAELVRHPRWRGFGDHAAGHPPMRGWLAAPLVGRDGRNLGLIQLSDKEDGSDFEEADEAMLVQLAQIASTAVEQTLAEEALRAGNGRFRAAIDATDGVLWTNDAGGRMVGEQPGWAALTGQSYEEYQGYGWADAVHPDDARPTMDAWTEAVAERKTYVFEHRVRCRDGEWRRFSVRAVPILRQDGSVAEWVGVHTDVTEQRAAQEALSEESRMLETLNRIGATLAAELDLERIVQTVTDAGVVLTGAEFGAFFYNVLNEAGDSYMLYTLSGIDRSAFEGFPMPRATAVFRPTFVGEGVIRSDDILLDDRYGRNDPHKGMPEGHVPVRSYLAVPVTSRSGEVLGGLFFGHPEPGRFTIRHERLMVGVAGQAAVAVDNARLFQAVQRAKETLESRVEERTAERNRVWAMSRDLLAVMGFDGYLKAVNPAWGATLGFDEATLLARPFPRQVHPDDHAAIAEMVERLRRGETIERFEDRLRHADGTWRWIAWTLVPEGDVFYAVGRDVTEEKEAAARLEQTQEALRQAQKMEAVGQLTGGIAHDFNNLLAAVVGSLDLIRRKPGEVERVRRFAEAGLQAAERGAKLTGQLLAFSRAQRIEPKPVIVSDLVAGMRDMVSRALGPLVRLNLDLAGDGAVLSDPTQLEMTVLNLAINARDAMPEGGDLVIATRVCWIGEDAELGPGDYVELAVSDTGTGMSPEVAAKAFDPFFTTKGVGKGTGLGLSQVYGIARQAGGTARIESRLGVGTTVKVVMPRTGTPVPPDAEAGGEDGTAAGASATILVVDDDPDVRRVLVCSLDALGYRVVEAADGPSGLAALEETAPDLMVVDFAMPGMNGAEMAKAARRRRPDLPIVFASGYADTAALESVAGPRAPVLRKPFRIEDLQAALRDAMAHRP